MDFTRYKINKYCYVYTEIYIYIYINIKENHQNQEKCIYIYVYFLRFYTYISRYYGNKKSHNVHHTFRYRNLQIFQTRSHLCKNQLHHCMYCLNNLYCIPESRFFHNVSRRKLFKNIKTLFININYQYIPSAISYLSLKSLFIKAIQLKKFVLRYQLTPVMYIVCCQNVIYRS